MENMFFLISVITILGGFSVAILAIVTNHKQKILLIEKNLVEEKKAHPGLRSGLTFALLGTFFLLLFWEWNSALSPVPWYTPGAFCLTLGLAQLLFYSLVRFDTRKDKKKIPKTMLS
ncbi:MAG: hypothetical protein ACOYJ1_08935 [Peptococcales bacterium]|jgi:hypothetical protein